MEGKAPSPLSSPLPLSLKLAGYLFTRHTVASAAGGISLPRRTDLSLSFEGLPGGWCRILGICAHRAVPVPSRPFSGDAFLPAAPFRVDTLVRRIYHLDLLCFSREAPRWSAR
jgi:hypothetical protein